MCGDVLFIQRGLEHGAKDLISSSEDKWERWGGGKGKKTERLMGNINGWRLLTGEFSVKYSSVCC